MWLKRGLNRAKSGVYNVADHINKMDCQIGIINLGCYILGFLWVSLTLIP